MCTHVDIQTKCGYVRCITSLYDPNPVQTVYTIQILYKLKLKKEDRYSNVYMYVCVYIYIYRSSLCIELESYHFITFPVISSASLVSLLIFEGVWCR